MLTLDCMDGVFVDGLLCDAGGDLLLLSVWGRDTAVQELLARLTLPDHDQGISSLTCEGEWDGKRVRQHARVPNAKLLDKEIGRAPGSVFGDLVQMFLYQTRLAAPDPATRSAWVVYRAGSQPPELWPLVRATCHVPLLDCWEQHVMAEFLLRGWIGPLQGLGVHAFGIDLGGEAVEEAIEALIASGKLPLPT